MLAIAEGLPTTFLAFEAADRAASAAPAELVARVLGGLQKAIWLLAASARADGSEPGAAERRRLELQCRPVDGCYVLGLGGPQLALALDWGASPAAVLAGLARGWGAIAAEDAPTLERLVPDLDLRRRFLTELRRALPRPTDRWRVVLDGVTVGPAGVRFLDRQLVVATASAPAVLTVTGELLGVDFDHGTFSLRYPPTRKTLSGRYAPESEVWLLKHRRKTIQVDGEFALDAHQRPQSCVAALRFRAVDLTPIALARAATDAGELVLDPPLELVPTLDGATGQQFEAREDLLGVYAASPTREGLESELARQIAELWARHAGPDPADPVLARAWRRRARLAPAEAFSET